MHSLKVAVLSGITITVLAALSLGIGVASAAPTSGCGTWQVVKSPNTGANLNILNGVATVSAHDVWAVGYALNYSTKSWTVLTEHWNGSQWSIVNAPSPSTHNNELNSAVALSTSDVWGVGDSGGQTLIEHWNGSHWGIFHAHASGILYGVSAVAKNDVWAVGYQHARNGGNVTLVVHWNGSTWSTVPSPNPNSNSNILQAVTAISANDIWAVGWFQASNLNEGTIVEHWNGSQWSVISSPNPYPGLDQLSAVSALSANNVWAVGEQGADGTLVEHWNGSHWSVVPSPKSAFGLFLGVAAVSARNIWAVGLYNVNSQVLGLIEHWNGSQWSVVSSPDPGSNGNVLRSVAQVPGTTSLWTVGDDEPKSQTANTLTEFYCA